MVGARLPGNASYLNVYYDYQANQDLQDGIFLMQQSLLRGALVAIFNSSTDKDYVPMVVRVQRDSSSAFLCSMSESATCLDDINHANTTDGIEKMYDIYWSWCQPGDCTKSHKKARYIYVVQGIAYAGGLYSVWFFGMINIFYMGSVAFLKIARCQWSEVFDTSGIILPGKSSPRPPHCQKC